MTRCVLDTDVVIAALDRASALAIAAAALNWADAIVEAARTQPPPGGG